MLKRLGGVAVKLALSALVIVAFIVLSAQAPFFRDDTPTLITTVPPLSGAGMAGLGSGAAQLSFAAADARFAGSFYALGQDSGFDLAELDIAGPCADAGRRHLEATCPDCLVTDAPLAPGQAATLFWSQAVPDGSMGTIFVDCSAELAGGMVRVPQLSFNKQTLSLAAATTDPASSLPIPMLAHSERTSSMTLGTWAIAVDAVRDENTALDSMGRILRDAGWRELAQAGQSGPVQNQRVYARDNSALCVVTLNEADEGYQLVTMMSI